VADFTSEKLNFAEKIFKSHEVEKKMSKFDWVKANQMEKLQRSFNQEFYGTLPPADSFTSENSSDMPKEVCNALNATINATDYDKDRKALFQVKCKVCQHKEWFVDFQSAISCIDEHEACR
jgi:hypothetical protein